MLSAVTATDSAQSEFIYDQDPAGDIRETVFGERVSLGWRERDRLGQPGWGEAVTCPVSASWGGESDTPLCKWPQSWSTACLHLEETQTVTAFETGVFFFNEYFTELYF